MVKLFKLRTTHDMLEVLKMNADWLNSMLRLEDFKTFALISNCMKLGFFEILERPMSAEEVARELNLNQRAVKAVCEFLKSKELLLEEEGKYRVSKISSMLLNKRSPFTVAEIFDEKTREVEAWLNLENYLKGENLRKREDFFKHRIKILGKMALLKDLKLVLRIAELEEFRKAKRLLDLGGGHGLYAYAFTLLNDGLRADVFDLPEVVNSAMEFLRPFNAERVNFVKGDFFRDDIGDLYDVVFSSFNPGGKRAELIPKISKALRKGGIYVNRQFFPRKGFSLEDLEWNLWGFEELKKGFKAYTFEGDLSFEDYLSKLKENNFEILDVFFEDSTVIIAKRL